MALGWFSMPWLLPHALFFLFRIWDGVVMGDAQEVPVREAARGILYRDDFVPDELAALLLVVLRWGHSSCSGKSSGDGRRPGGSGCFTRRRRWLRWGESS